MVSRQVARAEARKRPIAEPPPPSPDSGRTLKRKALHEKSLKATIKDIEDETRAVARGEIWHIDPKKRRPKNS